MIVIKHISLNVAEEIKNIFPETLNKDLQDDEIICPVCHGLGIIKQDYRFGVKEEDIEKNFKLNWYDNEYFIWCPHCYFGVQSLCEFCGNPIAKGVSRCNCEKSLEKEEMERQKRYQDKINRAKEIDLKYASYFLYDEESEQYFSDENDFADYYFNLYLDEIEDNYIPFDEYFEKYMPKVLWNCYEVKLYIDADSIVSDACDELHEDAVDNIDDINELQDFLDKWCAKQTGTTTYYPDYHEYVKVQRGWFDEIENES